MNKEENQFIGLVLLSLLMITYFYYFSPKKAQDTNNPSPKTTIKADRISQIKTLSQGTPPTTPPATSKDVMLENSHMCVKLSAKGGMLKHVMLKKYNNNNKTPLNLLNEKNSSMALLVSTKQGEIINTSELFFTIDQKSKDQVTFVAPLDPKKQQQIKYTYTLPQKGYTLSYKVDIHGFDTNTDKAQFVWHYTPPNLEKDCKLNQRYTYVQYQSQKKGLKYLNTDKKEKITHVAWSAIKQRFFTSAIIAPENTRFVQGELITKSTPSEDKNTLMETAMQLEIPLKKLEKNKGSFKFYFGPNIYSTLLEVAPGFENNHYLGPPIIKSINRYVILPLANFLNTHTSHYVWVLLLLVILFMLLKLPFAYKSHIITIKQKALQPAIAAISAKYTDKQQAKLAEMNFYTKMGLSPASFLIKLLPVLIEAPIFIATVYFIPSDISLRHVPFLWANDFSACDNFIKLPVHIPLLGNHISLFAMLMCLSSLLRSKQFEEQEPTSKNMQLFKYIMPIAIFFVFNAYPAAFCLYRIFTNLASLLPTLIFKLCVNENFYLGQMAKLQKNTPLTTDDRPRTLVRLEKNRKKK